MISELSDAAVELPFQSLQIWLEVDWTIAGVSTAEDKAFPFASPKPFVCYI
jgi:hypothetical protein